MGWVRGVSGKSKWVLECKTGEVEPVRKGDLDRTKGGGGSEADCTSTCPSQSGCVHTCPESSRAVLLPADAVSCSRSGASARRTAAPAWAASRRSSGSSWTRTGRAPSRDVFMNTVACHRVLQVKEVPADGFKASSRYTLRRTPRHHCDVDADVPTHSCVMGVTHVVQ